MDIHIVLPQAGKDYPRNWNEFLDWFGSEEACLAYLERLRWPQGFVCPSCGCIEEPYRSSRSRLMCRACAHQGTVTAGTIFDKTRTPLRVWLAAGMVLDQPEAWGQCTGIAARARPGQLPDSLDDAASVSAGDGTARPAAFDGRS